MSHSRANVVPEDFGDVVYKYALPHNSFTVSDMNSIPCFFVWKTIFVAQNQLVTCFKIQPGGIVFSTLQSRMSSLSSSWWIEYGSIKRCALSLSQFTHIIFHSWGISWSIVTDHLQSYFPPRMLDLWIQILRTQPRLLAQTLSEHFLRAARPIYFACRHLPWRLYFFPRLLSTYLAPKNFSHSWGEEGIHKLPR
jgi:hypothetical protein